MRATVTAAFVVTVFAACLAVTASETRHTRQQPTGLFVATGTATLSGAVVTDSNNPRPVHRATVRVTATGGTSARVVGTDQQGRFSIDGLPAGNFTVSAAKPGYVTVFHGAKRPGRGPGVPVAVGEGQRVDVTLKILPGASVTGVVTTPNGNPAPGIPIAVVDVRRPGMSAPAPVRGVTDDRGVYRVFGLPPGDYLVSALPRLVPTGEGRGTASATGVVQITDAEVQWARAAAASGISRATPVGAASSPPPPGRLVSYTPVFYPGVTDASAAAPVSVAAGEERANISLTIRAVPMARVSGTLADQNGQPVPNASVALYPPRTTQPSAADALIASGALTFARATVSPTTFSFLGVAPGRYTLVARTGGGRRGAEPTGAPPTLWSVTELNIDGNDQANLALRLLPGLKVSGSIAFERSSAAPPDDLSRTDLTLVQTGSSIGNFTTPRAIVSPRGTFEFTSVVPGPYTLRAITSALPDGGRWTLKSAVLNGRDLADGAFELPAGADIDGLQLTFTDRAAEIAGRLIDAEGRPVTRYSIIVFTVERALWLPNARRIKLQQPATDGSFTIGGLPPGDYAVVAAENVEDVDLTDHAFLLQLLASAYRINVAEGEKKRQDLKVGSR